MLRLPRSALRRGAITWAKLLRKVQRDRVSGGWNFDGDLVRPGATVDARQLPAAALVLECAGSEGPGHGHNRADTAYILWRLEAGEWRQVARVASASADWTRDLGPIARRELDPPRPVLVDPDGAAGRIMESLEHELESLDRAGQRLVVLKVYDQVAARVVEA